MNKRSKNDLVLRIVDSGSIPTKPIRPPLPDDVKPQRESTSKKNPKPKKRHISEPKIESNLKHPMNSVPFPVRCGRCDKKMTFESLVAFIRKGADGPIRCKCGHNILTDEAYPIEVISQIIEAGMIRFCVICGKKIRGQEKTCKGQCAADLKEILKWDRRKSVRKELEEL